MQETERDDLQVYEVGFHILPTVAEGDLSGEVVKVRDLISSVKGSVISEGFPEMTNLSYEIAKRIDGKYVDFNRAYFGWIKFDLDRTEIEKVDSALKANPQILRYIIIKTVKENTLYVPKISAVKKSTDGELDGVLVSEMTPKEYVAPVSEEEMDKSIDDLVIEN